MDNDLLYSLEDKPPIFTTIMLALQQYLTMFGGTIAIPFVLSGLLCAGEDDTFLGYLLGTILFVSGIVTFLQATFGVRLPIIQGGSFAFIPPVAAIMGLEKWKCSSIVGDMSNNNGSFLQSIINDSSSSTESNMIASEELWRPRILEIQGAIICAAMIEVIIGFSGVIGILLRFIGPLTIAPTIALIGLSLFEISAIFCQGSWPMAILTMSSITIFSQYLRNVNIPCLSFNREKRCHTNKLPFFKLFPVIISIGLAWLTCFILTATNVFPADPKLTGYNARTDIKIDYMNNAKWFRFPYPFQWGMPTFSLASIIGILGGVLASMVESIGDYYAAARLSGTRPPPIHAINRGLFIEGCGCMVAGIFGTGNGTTSYSENIGAIGVTKVASRRVTQVAAIIVMLLGVFGKFSALFVTIPKPIVGGVFMTMFGMVAAVGVSNLQFVDLNSSRNLFVFGISLFSGLSIPHWLNNNPNAINTGSLFCDHLLEVLLKTSMFLGGMIACILDNTIPGSIEERGIATWAIVDSENDNDESYSLPSCCMSCVLKIKIFRFLPLCPNFVGCCKRKESDRALYPHKQIPNDEFLPNSDIQIDLVVS